MSSCARISFVLAAALFVAGDPGGALAQGAPAGVQPTPVGTFKDWNAYAAPVKGGKVCYALATPQAGRASRRRAAPPPPAGAYFFISNRPQDNVLNEVSVMPGFTPKAGSQVKVEVDRAAFNLFVRGDGAFMNSNEEQAQLVNAMRGGHSMKITAVSGRGRPTSQAYSLQGIASALDKINDECRGAKR